MKNSTDTVQSEKVCRPGGWTSMVNGYKPNRMAPPPPTVPPAAPTVPPPQPPAGRQVDHIIKRNSLYAESPYKQTPPVTTTPNVNMSNFITQQTEMTELNEHELDKIEMFYRSHRTFVFVGQCMACLYITETDLVDGGRSSRPRFDNWKALLKGVPVLLFNRGDTKSRDKRQVKICVAERKTGFQLWSDVIDNLSNYTPLFPNFHTMYLSTDHRKMIGLSFESQSASIEFYRQIESIVSNPLNIALTGPKKKSSSSANSGDSSTGEKFRLFRRTRSKSVGRNESTHSGSKVSPTQRGTLPLNDPFLFSMQTPVKANGKWRNKPTKQDISSPCLFQHVTSVNLNNCDPNEFAASDFEQLQLGSNNRAQTYSNNDHSITPTHQNVTKTSVSHYANPCIEDTGMIGKAQFGSSSSNSSSSVGYSRPGL